MKKLYSLVLMATALLIGTNVWAKDHVAQIVGGVSYETLEAAFAAAQAAQGDQTIVMLANDTLTKPIDFGKATSQAEYTAAHKVVTLDFKGKTVTMDVVGATNGKKKVNNVNVKQDRMFNVYSGALKLVNSTPAAGGGLHHTYNSGKYYTILVFGSIRKDCDPSEDKEDKLGYYTYLSIGEGVNIVSDGEKTSNGGICVMIMPNGTAKAAQNPVAGGNLTTSNIWNGYTTCGSYIYTIDYKDDTHNYKVDENKNNYNDPRGVANGVRIDVYGHLEGSLYAMQSNGQLAGPDDKYKESDSYYNTYKNIFYDNKISGGEVADISDDDKDYAPYIHIHQGAVLTNKKVVGDDLKPKQVALYTSGYARWYVEGECSGTTGLYMKSGDVTLKNATISSSFEGTATNNSGQTIGVSGQGNAVVVESNDHYSGHLSLNIEGTTEVKTPAEGGTALLETIAPLSDPNVEHIDIKGGTLTGDNAIAISDQTASEKVVTFYGGNFEGDVNAGNLEDLLPKNGDYHITDVIVDGKTTVVVSEGKDPAASNTVSGATDLTAIKWNGTEDIIANGTKTLTELEINETFAQTLTIADGAQLIVGRLILGGDAKIIVNAGGKLIITGTQGVNADKVSNIVLESTKTKQAVLLFNPLVSTNRYPKATVKMYSANGKNNNSEYLWTRFGMPIRSLDAVRREHDYTTWIYEWDYVANAGQGDWALVQNVSTDMAPWKGYTLAYDAEGEQTYSFEGNLVGNDNAPVNFVHKGYNFFGNSYTSYVDAKTLVQSLPAAVDQTVYMWNVDEQAYATATMDNLVNHPNKLDGDWQKDVAPMTTFILRLMDQDNASASIDYSSALWSNPRHGNAGSGSNAAPAKHAPARNVSEDTFIKMVVTAANGKSDRINLTEDAEFTDAYENGYDASKYMNEKSINLYASINGENYSDVVTNSLVGKTISMQTVNDVNYTISFKHADANEYAVRDNLTGAIFAIEEGTTYEFSAQPNSTIEGRFEIVGRNNMPTAIENTEAKANVKGIYSITGMYLGEDFEALPAGVYVVNGVKIVK